MKLTARQIADIINGTIEGDEDAVVVQIAKIEEAMPGTLTFLANPVYTPYIYTTKASVVIVGNAFYPEQPLNCTIIRVGDPYGALAKLLEFYKKSKPEKKGVSPLAFLAEDVQIGENSYIGEFVYIGQNVRLGKGVKINPHCYIGDDVSIGDGTVLYSGVRIYENSVIGSACTIHSNVVIGADGFGFAPQGSNGYIKVQQIGNVIIGDHVEIGAGTAIDRATMGSTVIHNGVKLDNLIQIGHNVVVGENTVMAGQAGVAGSAKIGRNCLIGGQVGIAGHLTIGDDVKIGAQSGVTSNIKSGETRLGSPALDVSITRKSFVHFRNLDKIVDRLTQLEHEVKGLKKP